LNADRGSTVLLRLVPQAHHLVASAEA